MNAITEVSQRAVSAASTHQLSAGPMANAIAALQAGMTIESLKGIMELQKDWEANEARKSYVADMAEFKLNPPEIYKTKLVAFSGTEYMHATIGDVTKAIVEALASHGFSHSWETRQDASLITVICKITHRMGHSESTSLQSSPDVSGKKNSIQAIASAQTYLQRYTLLAACGLATMDLPDDDGRGWQPEPDRVFQNDRQPEPRQPAGLPEYSDEEFTSKLGGWKAIIESGKKTPDTLISFLQTKVTLTASQINQIKGA
jgi:hypothetical protein